MSTYATLVSTRAEHRRAVRFLAATVADRSTG
jgi:hypothetical protein